MNKKILGVDVGGVIIDGRRNDNTDTSFKGVRFLETTSVQNAFESLRELNSRFNGLIYVVLKCGLATELKTRKWLAHHNFYDITRILPADIYYCRERQEKAPICEFLGITHFIDDGMEVLSYLKSVPNKYLFYSEEENEKCAIYPDLSFIRADSWEEILNLIK